MPMTPDSGAAPYATAADMLARYDARTVGELAADDGTRASAAQLTATPDPATAVPAFNLNAALMGGSGLVESVAVAGARYRPVDLAALGGNTQALLKDLVCAVAFQRLRRRRGLPDSELPQVAEAQDWLKALSEGVRIFGTLESEQAGLPGSYTMRDADFGAIPLPSNLTRYFGRRSERDFS